MHAVLWTLARHFAKRKNDPAFWTKLQVGAGLAIHARGHGFTFRAVVADSGHGDHDGFRTGLAEARQPFVMALRPYNRDLGPAPPTRTPRWKQRGCWPGALMISRTGRRSCARSATGHAEA